MKKQRVEKNMNCENLDGIYCGLLTESSFQHKLILHECNPQNCPKEQIKIAMRDFKKEVL